jgi:hypothetical protein
MLPLLSLALSMVLPPLPLYPLSRPESPLTAFLAAGRLAGGAGGLGLPFAGRAGGAGGGGGAAARWTTSSRYAEGAQPEADLSRRDASHQPVTCSLVCQFIRRSGCTYHCPPSV